MALGPVKPHVQASAEAIATRFGIRTMYGWRPVDPFPDHPSGLAVDFMISNLPNGKSVGDGLAAYVAQNGKALGVKYLIWYRRSYNVSRGTWVPYTGSTNPHTDHVHVTWESTPGSGGMADAALDVTPVGNPVSAVETQVQAIYDMFARVSKLADWVQNPTNVLRIQIGMFGIIFLVIGLLRFEKVRSIVGNVKGMVPHGG